MTGWFASDTHTVGSVCDGKHLGVLLGVVEVYAPCTVAAPSSLAPLGDHLQSVRILSPPLKTRVAGSGLKDSKRSRLLPGVGWGPKKAPVTIPVAAGGSKRLSCYADTAGEPSRRTGPVRPKPLVQRSEVVTYPILQL